MIPSGPTKDKPSPWDFYNNVLMPAQGLFRAMHHEGFVIDHGSLGALDEEFTGDINDLEEEMWSLEDVNQEFNPRSPQQVAGILFDKLRLTPVRGRSTDEEVLTRLKEVSGHPLCQMMLNHRSLTKIHGTYVKGIGSHIAADGRLHPEFLPHGAVSRTSSRNPNVQNIPRKGDQEDAPAAAIKKLFTCPYGWLFGHVDYSQHEFRQVAIYSEDDWLTEVYNGPKPDMHGEIAVEFYGKDYTYEDKIKAKAINFGLLYQRGAPSLAAQIGGSVYNAQERIEQFFARMPDVRFWIKDVKDTVLNGDDLASLLGRHRRFGLITRQNLDETMKQAVNFLPQSSGSDSALMGVHNAWKNVSSDVYRPIGFHHDAQTFYIREDVWEEVLPEIMRLMVEGAQELIPSDVPFAVEAEIGPSWGLVEKVEIDYAA